jgi:hypothetical protein
MTLVMALKLVRFQRKALESERFKSAESFGNCRFDSGRHIASKKIQKMK